MATASHPKPFVVVCVSPIYGHLMPLVAIAKALIKRRYDVTMITGSFYQHKIEEIGAAFVPLSGYSNFTEVEAETRWPEEDKPPEGPERFAYEMREILVKSLPSQFAVLNAFLEDLRAKDASRPIVVINDLTFIGALATLLGAGIRPTAVIGIGTSTLGLSSIDLPPFGLGLLPDTTPEGRERNKAMNKHVQEVLLGSPQEEFQRILGELGVRSPYFFLDAQVILPDRFLQLCIPSVEYSRSDAPSSIRFVGNLPQGARDPWTEFPVWWDEVAVNSQKKHIVAVSQGTIEMDFSKVIIPTMQGLKDNSDFLVVVALGRKGATLPAGTEISSNARVLDFIPFDDLFEHASVFVTNGGYGGFQHAVGHGLPLVIAGTTQEKPEVASRAEWAGVAINLRSGNPTPGAVRDAVEEIISNPKYKTQALELQAEMKTYDPFQLIANTVDEFSASSNGQN